MKLTGLQKAHYLAARYKGTLAAKRPATGISAKAADSKTGSLYIYEPIGPDYWTGGGVTAKSIQAALDALKGVKTLNIYINSEGGDVFEAKAIYSQLQRFQAEKVCHVDGLAASAATFIAMAGDRITTSPVSTWMVHEAAGFAFGRAGDFDAFAALLRKENATIAETYARQTGGSVEEMLELMAAETWMNAQEALDAGFADEISSRDECPCGEGCKCDGDCSCGPDGSGCACGPDCPCGCSAAEGASARAPASPIARAAARTQEQLREMRDYAVDSARRAHRLSQLSTRASPDTQRNTGQP